jgi:hypothetical protein
MLSAFMDVFAFACCILMVAGLHWGMRSLVRAVAHTAAALLSPAPKEDK